MPGGSSKSHDICFARVDNRSRQKQPATGHCMVPSQMAQFDPNQTRFQERRGLSDSTPGCSSSSIMAVGRSGILLTGGESSARLQREPAEARAFSVPA